MKKKVVKSIVECIKDYQIISIDGPAGSGKTSLAKEIKKKLKDTNVVMIDHFYMTKEQRNNQQGHFNVWNYDYDRLIKEVIEPWMKHQTIEYSTYDYFTDQITDKMIQEPKSRLVIEGVTSSHPKLRPYIDFGIWVAIDQDKRLEYGIERDGERFRSLWIEEWMPSEKDYIQKFKPDQFANIKIINHQIIINSD